MIYLQEDNLKSWCVCGYTLLKVLNRTLYTVQSKMYFTIKLYGLITLISSTNTINLKILWQCETQVLVTGPTGLL